GEASWRSGDAEDCKSLHPGSIPGEASNFRFPVRFPNTQREIRRFTLVLTSHLPTRSIFLLSSLEDTPPSPKRLCGSLWLPPFSFALGFHDFPCELLSGKRPSGRERSCPEEWCTSWSSFRA